MGNKRDRRSRRAQSPSYERQTNASTAEVSQGNEYEIETLSSFESVRSARNREAVLNDGSKNENEMQVRT